MVAVNTVEANLMLLLGRIENGDCITVSFGDYSAGKGVNKERKK